MYLQVAKLTQPMKVVAIVGNTISMTMLLLTIVLHMCSWRWVFVLY